MFFFIPLGSKQRLPKTSKKSKMILRIFYINKYVSSFLDIIESSRPCFLLPDLTMFHKRSTVTPKLQGQKGHISIIDCALQREEHLLSRPAPSSCPLPSFLASKIVPETISAARTSSSATGLGARGSYWCLKLYFIFY